MENKNSNLTCWPVNSAGELDELKAFLRECELPHADIRLNGNLFAIYRDEFGRIVGTGGLEFHGTSALLRSIAVASEFRKHGFGKVIATDLIERAKGKSLLNIYLLTETAQPFFERLGFKTKSRDDAPSEIKASSQFSSVCPASAAFMALDVSR